VFSPNLYTEIVTNPTILTTSFPTDLNVLFRRNSASGAYWSDRLRGSTTSANGLLTSFDTASEFTYGISPFLFDNNTGVKVTSLFNNTSGSTDVDYQFRRAPSFFDEVCYTGTGANRTVAHNLGVAPELMIFKVRSTTDGWQVYCSALDASGGDYLLFNDSAAKQTNGSTRFTAAPTSTLINLATNGSVNGSGSTYVAYLFATCAGVSKVGSYTGNGSTQTIDCGFGASGARFVLIKRTNSTGDWYVYDTARGMTVLTDPYLWMNSTNAEVATLGSVTTVSTGFALNSAITAAINVNGGHYIFLAIA
jgi:hypothetical protein